MNRDRDKASILDVLAMLVIIVFFAGSSAAGLTSSVNIGSLLLGGLALLITWFLIKDLRRGVRPPTRWEWFKAWMIVRPVLIGAAGFAFFMSFLNYDRSTFLMDNDTFGMIMVGIALIWGVLIFYTIWRAPHRRESDAAYQKRMRWKDPEE
jgi:hypothetical protein